MEAFFSIFNRFDDPTVTFYLVFLGTLIGIVFSVSAIFVIIVMIENRVRAKEDAGIREGMAHVQHEVTRHPEFFEDYDPTGTIRAKRKAGESDD